MEHDEVGTWLTTPNSNFNMDKPVDFFWEGGQEKIYRILYFIDIGEADLYWMPVFEHNGKYGLFIHIPKTGGKSIIEYLKDSFLKIIAGRSDDFLEKTCSA